MVFLSSQLSYPISAHFVSSLPLRSAMYDRQTRDCRLLDQDRHTLAGLPVFQEEEGVDYLEVNCKDVDVSR